MQLEKCLDVRIEMIKKKIVVGLSGGVDSTAALILLKNNGWDPVGVSLKYAVWEDKCNSSRENICCSEESFEISQKICKELNVPYHIVDVSKEFKNKVINYFTGEFKKLNTPNPCIICNRSLKFKKLFQWANASGIKYVATGHYAKILMDSKTKTFQLAVSKDLQKDQTYSLSFLPFKWLGNIVFPLENYFKDEVYQIVKDAGFQFYLKKKQSQDFCFVNNQALKFFLEKEIGINKGPIKEISGNSLGTHQGLHFYTIGQRKGLNLSGGPFFVVKKTKKDNTLWISKNEKDLLHKTIKLKPHNFLTPPASNEEIRVKARLRYRQNLADAILSIENSCLKLTFFDPQKAPTYGQFAVFYQDDICLGGGKIAR